MVVSNSFGIVLLSAGPVYSNCVHMLIKKKRACFGETNRVLYPLLFDLESYIFMTKFFEMFYCP